MYDYKWTNRILYVPRGDVPSSVRTLTRLFLRFPHFLSLPLHCVLRIDGGCEMEKGDGEGCGPGGPADGTALSPSKRILLIFFHASCEVDLAKNLDSVNHSHPCQLSTSCFQLSSYTFQPFSLVGSLDLVNTVSEILQLDQVCDQL